jgi:hypothetical protein
MASPQALAFEQRGRVTRTVALRFAEGAQDDASRAPWVRPALVAVLASALAVRLLWLDSTGFNSDEAVYAGQAASIAGDAQAYPYFPIFRAHPLLFQTVLSLAYRLGTDDLVGRLVAVAFGLVTVRLTYAVGRELYGVRVGLVAAAVVAVMPYQVVVTRQVLLDGPMVTFSTLALFLVARYARRGDPVWLYAAGAALGLACLTKETAALLLGSVYAFLALSQQLRHRVRHAAVALVVWLGVFAAYPVSLRLADRGRTGQSFLAWQLFRRPNHPWYFYFAEVPPALGWAVVAFAVTGLVLAFGRWHWRETLLVCWTVVPVVVFTVWAVKGFQYLLPVSPPIAVLAAAGVFRTATRLGERRRVVATLCTATVVLLTLVPTMQRITPSDSPTFLAGSGGVPGGRESGEWIRQHVPEGAQLLALGPSMANILQFYGHRKVYGLSVSTNPLNRNPTYVPISNPDLAIRRNLLQYVVWDSFSAARSDFFSARLRRYAERYHGRVVHLESVPVRAPDGETVAKPVVIIYEVRP